MEYTCSFESNLSKLMEGSLINFETALSLSIQHFWGELRIKFNEVQYFFFYG